MKQEVDDSDILLRDMMIRAEPGRCYSQVEIAEYCGISQAAVHQAEKRAKRAAFNKLQVLIKSSRLFDGTDSTSEFY